MKNEHLAVYLNDHLAGAVGALEILERLIKIYTGKPVANFCAEMHREVAADQTELRQVMEALAISESSVRQAGAWVGEKLSRLKLRMEGEESGEPGLALAFESLVLGIKGKEVLWRALLMIQPVWPQLQPFDFERLVERAINQGAQVDQQRLAAVRDAFRPEPN